MQQKYLRIPACLVVGAMMVFSSIALSAEEARTKVVVVDLQRAVMTTAVAREQLKALELKKEYAETRKKAEGLQADMEKKMAEAKKEGPAWTSDQQSRYRNDMEYMQKELQLAVQKIQSENQDLMREIMKDAEPKLKQSLQQIIEAEKISMVIDKNAAIFAGAEVDITEKLTAKLNALK